MKVLLLAMPNSSDTMETSVRMPNLALVSIAGSLVGHEVKVLDLILKKPEIKKAITTLLDDYEPQVVGLSGMTFQFDTLLRIARFIKDNRPTIKIIVGGYHATLMYREICNEQSGQPFDFVVRGEGEATFNELMNELESTSPVFESIKGLSYLKGADWHHNPPRELLDLDTLPLPNRSSRVDQSFHMLTKPMDVIETSRGCPHNCKFCCITHMYGQHYRQFPIDRVVEDLRVIKQNGTKAVFIVDDNITHSIGHLTRVCQAIIDHKLNDLEYMTQVTAAGMANNPELVELMSRANFTTAFVGFESMDPSALRIMKKPTSPEINQKAATNLRKHNIGIIAGTIVGFPDDNDESVKKQLAQIRGLIPDAIYVQYLTPYPKTLLRDEMLAAELVVEKEDFSQYDGFSCVVRTKHLSREELYRIKKIECMKGYFNPKMVWSNYFLKHHFLAFLIHELKNIQMLIMNIFTLKQRKNNIDI